MTPLPSFFQESFHVKKGQKNTQNKDPQQKHRGETEPLKNRQGFKFSNNFEDDLDDNVDEKTLVESASKTFSNRNVICKKEA